MYWYKHSIRTSWVWKEFYSSALKLQLFESTWSHGNGDSIGPAASKICLLNRNCLFIQTASTTPARPQMPPTFPGSDIKKIATVYSYRLKSCPLPISFLHAQFPWHMVINNFLANIKLSFNLSPLFIIPKALNCTLLVKDFHWRWEWPTQIEIWLSHQSDFLLWPFLRTCWFPSQQPAQSPILIIYKFNRKCEVNGEYNFCFILI